MRGMRVRAVLSYSIPTTVKVIGRLTADMVGENSRQEDRKEHGSGRQGSGARTEMSKGASE